MKPNKQFLPLITFIFSLIYLLLPVITKFPHVYAQLPTPPDTPPPESKTISGGGL